MQEYIRTTDWLRETNYINGQWTGANDGRTLAVEDPATGKQIGTIALSGAIETHQAIDAAHAVFQHWSMTTAFERAERLQMMARLVRENLDDLAAMLTLEQGKPLVEARAEITLGADYIQWFADAISKGGQVLVGGKRHSLGATFFEPTVIANAADNMLIAHEETFAPVAALFRFKEEQEAIEKANTTEFGLASYFYTRNLSRIFRVSRALESGMVGVNAGLVTTEVAPFGGVKQSGLGSEGSSHSIEEYLHLKYINLGA
ncbi:aldehyde dehydrogenase family protein [Vibrio mimicus]|uniref:aldehyde dehydrogenase family protein n=1 Tax=Vibrio mimicus TaxID=674 RepID=UPI0011D6036D|nr:aldehyde dehydrogenase family protein [Vibrio mimicus]TXZ76915.1 aldehyde dehydrogenase family protein [Vibrio mimicus]